MAEDERPTSVWKKELSFRRKPRAERDVESDGDGDGDGASSAAGESIWKKEISFRKKPHEEDPIAAVLPEEPAPDPVDLDLDTLVLPIPVVVPEQPAQAPAAQEPVAHDWLTAPLEQVSEPPAEPLVPVAEAVAEAPRAPLQALPELPPEPAAEPEPPAALEPAAPEPAPVTGAATSLVDPEIVAAFAELVEPAETEAAQVAAELAAAPLPELPAPRLPFYKRELSFGRKEKTEKEPKARRPKAEKPPKEPKEPKARKPKARKEPKPKPTGEHVPFYKRELSFGRKPKAQPETAVAEAPTAVVPVAAAAPAKATSARPKLRGLPRPAPIQLGGGKKSVVGLKIGASQLAAARVANGGDRELLQAVRAPLEPGIVVGGELRDPEALAVALRAFFRKHRLPRRGIRLGIANNRIGVRTFEVSGISDAKQLDNAIKFRAQEVLPIPIEEAVLDYQVLSESRDEEGVVTRRVLLVVAYRELVDRYVSACRKAGLQIVGIDLEAFALLRALAEPREPVAEGGVDRGALVAVSVGHERSTFAVSDGRVCEFTRVLEWGGWALNVAIARELDLAPSEAEEIKRSLSFAGTQELPEGVTPEQLEVAREAARRQLGVFARELVSSLQFYQNQPGSLGIAEVVVTGGTAHLPGLGAELERLVGVPVRVGDPLTRVKVSKKVREREQVGSLAVAIGLGIED